MTSAIYGVLRRPLLAFSLGVVVLQQQGAPASWHVAYVLLPALAAFGCAVA
jgi:hypothetical protein